MVKLIIWIFDALRCYPRVDYVDLRAGRLEI